LRFDSGGDSALIEQIAFVSAIILPLWNIPLIVRVIKRRSSKDISLYWALGVWICLALMAPSAFFSEDRIWRVFSITNFIFFSLVVITVVFYRKEK
jgi:uncharacterized protein with PQ loop repeat